MHINVIDDAKKTNTEYDTTSHRCRLNNKKRRRKKKKGEITVSRISDFKTAPPHINQVLSNRETRIPEYQHKKNKEHYFSLLTTSASSDISCPPQVETHRLPPVNCLLCYTRSLFISNKLSSSGSWYCGVSALFLIQHFAERSCAVRAFCLDCREDLPVLVTVLESRAAGNTLRRRLH